MKTDGFEGYTEEASGRFAPDGFPSVRASGGRRRSPTCQMLQLMPVGVKLAFAQGGQFTSAPEPAGEWSLPNRFVLAPMYRLPTMLRTSTGQAPCGKIRTNTITHISGMLIRAPVHIRELVSYLVLGANIAFFGFFWDFVLLDQGIAL